MKECPICHELNEDNRDTCYKCHASLDFKVYRADEIESNTKECPNCYAVNNINSYSCYNCGRSFHEVNSVIDNTDKECTCVHCGTTIENGDVLCKKCRRKRVLFIVASVPISFLVSLLALAAINIILISLFQLQLGWALRSILMISIFLGFGKYAENLILKTKKVKTNKKKTPKSKIDKTTNDNISENNTANSVESKQKIKNSFCQKCGSTLDENKKCTSCGKQYFYPQRFIKNLQPKYCKECGGLIDTNTKRCTSCSKQYFNIAKLINKYTIIITSIVLSLVIAFTTFLFLTQKSYNDKLIVIKSEIAFSGSFAYININGKPNTEYKITATYNDGSNEQTGVSPKTTNSTGNAGWRWYLSKATAIGICNIRVESDFEYSTTTIMIS